MIRDEFYWLSQMNKATIIANSAGGLLKPQLAHVAAKALKEVIDSGKDPANRVKRVIDFEPKLIAAAGTSEVTEIHVGRSSQDMHSTFRVAIMRDEVLSVAKGLESVIDALLELARNHQDTVMPSYTNGVAAQPTSFAHYLLGFIEGFKRDRVRLTQFFSRLNYCPMGSCVLNGTGWPLNRKLMAKLLGFHAPIRNAFDATQIAMVDLPVEFAQIQASIALHIGSMIADCRGNASDVVSEANLVITRAHNVPSGMIDGKSVKVHAALAQESVKTMERFVKILKALVVNKERALEELSLDWTASQEIADRLMSEYGLPFRVGHHVASGMVSFARANGILPLTFPYKEMQRIYAETVHKEMPGFATECPMSEEEFKASLDPREILKRRRTEGSANPEEVSRMLAELTSEMAILKEQTTMLAAAIDQSMADLDSQFEPFLQEVETK